MNKPIFIKLTGAKAPTPIWINACGIDIFTVSTKEGGISCTLVYSTSGAKTVVKETPEQIEAALKAAGIQVIDCGASVEEKAEEPKQYFRVIGNTCGHRFQIGEKVRLVQTNEHNSKYSNGKEDWLMVSDEVEPWTDEPVQEQPAEVASAEEPKNCYRIIGNTSSHGFKAGEKVWLLTTFEFNARYHNGKESWLVLADDVEPWTDETPNEELPF